MKKLCLILVVALVLSVVNVPIIASAETLVSIELTTDKVGNIFYNDEEVVITANCSAADVPAGATVTYQVYKFDTDNNPVRDGEPIVEALNEGDAQQTVSLPAEEFGLYKVEVTYNSEVVAETEFSRSAKSSVLNYSLGAHAGGLKDKSSTDTNSVNQRSRVEKQLDLMVNAGLGLLRTDFPWKGYESYATQGIFGLEGLQRDENWAVILEEATKRELNVLPVLGINHDHYSNGEKFLPEENIEKFETFVEKLVSEPLFKSANIDMVEVGNEPERTGLANTDTAAQFAERGHKVSYIYEAAYNKIKFINPEIKVGIGSLAIDWCNDKGKAFVNAFLSDFGDNKYYDAVTVHPYASMLSQAPETNINTYNDYYRNLMDTEVWHTEFGWSAPGQTSEFMQGVYIIRQYANSLAHNNNDKFYMYNLVNSSGDTDNTFGLVKGTNYVVPYAAKYAYLQIANLNRLIADKETCEYVVNGQNNVVKFSGKWTDKEVYMLWTTNSRGSNLSYSVPGENIVYYDILGNEIDKTAGSYSLTNVPFYAVTGGAVADEPEATVDGIEVDVQTGMATFEGTTVPNSKVTIMVLAPGADLDNPGNEDIVYINEAKTGNDGNYSFSFKPNKNGSGQYTIRYNIGGGGRSDTYTCYQKVIIPTIEVFAGSAQVRTLNEIENALDQRLTLKVDMPTEDATTVIFAQYKGSVLVDAYMDVLTDYGKQWSVAYQRGKDVDGIRVFLWEPVTQAPIKKYKIN